MFLTFNPPLHNKSSNSFCCRNYFEQVCMLCIICLMLMYLETAFGICVGCKLYQAAVAIKLLPKPKEKPNCMGDSCAADS